jgi:hypothetical protein
MSTWYEVKDKEDISISEDGKMLQVNFAGDDNGNIWVEIPLKFIEQIYRLKCKCIDKSDWKEVTFNDCCGESCINTKYRKD